MGNVFSDIERILGERLDVAIQQDSMVYNETSDRKLLCANPLVSVHMLTYNQAKYISAAIEGVVGQETDFEYELIIGEDCSNDGTRQICLEYQRRYPNIIRVIWSDVNVYRNGGNSCRVHQCCRGVFVAFCEGDDYWTDKYKLQKQVDVMLKYPTVSVCFTNGQRYIEKFRKYIPWESESVFTPGLIKGRAFFEVYLNDLKMWTMTASRMYRKQLMDSYLKTKFGEMVDKYALKYSDLTMDLSASQCGDVYYIKDKTVVYRQGVGVCLRSYKEAIIGLCIRFAFAKQMEESECCNKILHLIYSKFYHQLPWMSHADRIFYGNHLLKNDLFAGMSSFSGLCVIWILKLSPFPFWRFPLLLRRCFWRALGRKRFVSCIVD